MADKLVTDFDLPLSPIVSAREQVPNEQSRDDEPNQQSPINFKVVDQSEALKLEKEIIEKINKSKGLSIEPEPEQHALTPGSIRQKIVSDEKERALKKAQMSKLS